jgi:carboxyl-terminal processing protease
MKYHPSSRAVWTLAGTLFVLAATTLVAQQLPLPKSKQPGDIAKLVCQMVEANHISQHKVDDAISAKIAAAFVKDLDPQKMYFLKSDLDDLQKSSTILDDELQKGNLDFAFNVFNLFLQRIDERIVAAHPLIDLPHDFAKSESMEVYSKHEDIPWAASAAELSERWRKRIKYELLLMRLEKKTDDATAAKDAPKKVVSKNDLLPPPERLHKRYKNILANWHKFEEHEVLELYLSAMCSSFDPHSSYMSPRTVNDFQIQMRLSLEGIGAALRSEDGYTIVATIVPGGAAHSDGRLKVGDKIVGVATDEKAALEDVIEMKLTKVVDRIRGKAGTKVRLKVVTEASGETIEYQLTRQRIELKSSEVKGEIIKSDDRLKGAGSQARIGVIHIPSFYRDFGGAENGQEDFKSTARDVKQVLRNFKTQGGVDAIVIDLRTNGGGALSEAIEVSGLFIDAGPVVQVKNTRGKAKSLTDDEAGVDYAGPLVVLCNRLSASASEIFAGVIKDYGRGLVLGDSTTHGKGTVQSVMNVSKQGFQFSPPPDLGALKLTVQQFYRVNGDSTQERGVPSDVVLPSLVDHMDLGESSLPNAMAFDRIAPAEHARLGWVTPEMISSLQERSRKRVAQSDDFQKIERDIAKYVDRKKRKSVSLNEDELRKERVEEEQKTKEIVDNADDAPEGPIFPTGAYNNEVLSITLDYATVLREMKTAKK